MRTNEGLGSRRSKMFPTGFIGVCRLGARKVIFAGFDKKKNFYSTFFLIILFWFRILNKFSKNMPVWWGVKVRVKASYSSRHFYYCKTQIQASKTLIFLTV